MGGSHLARQECLLVSYRPLAHENRFLLSLFVNSIATWPYRETRPQTSLCAQQRLTDGHNSTNELTANFIEFPAAVLAPPTRPVDAARESARYQFEEKQAAQRRAHLLSAHRLDGVPGC